MPKVNTVVAYARFNNAQTIVARPMSDAEDALYVRGEELAASDFEVEIDWQEALHGIDREGRAILRTGYVALCVARGKVPGRVHKDAKPVPVAVRAAKRFDNRAAEYAPLESSRKAKATTETRGRKEKATATVSKMSEKDVAQRLVAVLAYIASAQAKHAGDSEMLEVLGDIAKLANGGK